jgi:hypothetical protein
VLLVLATAGCGGGGGKRASTQQLTRMNSPGAAAGCLNTDLFIVSQSGDQVSGSSPGGVNFTVTFHKTAGAAVTAAGRRHPAYTIRLGTAVVDDFGNPPAQPGGAPMRLTHDDIVTLRHCIQPLKLHQ